MTSRLEWCPCQPSSYEYRRDVDVGIVQTMCGAFIARPGRQTLPA